VGSLAAGFVILPTIGLVRGMLLIALVNVLVALAFFRSAEGRGSQRAGLAFGGAAALALLVMLIAVRPTPFILHTKVGRMENTKLLFQEEGHTATVTVTEETTPEGKFLNRSLHINLLGAAVVDADHRHQQYYSLIALVPQALHPDPKAVFVAGLASGVTTGAAALHEGTRQVMCVEISPEVVEAARLLGPWNYDAMTNPKIRVLADDARAYLATTPETFDVLVTDVFISAVTGTSALYSTDYFELCRRRLSRGGFMSVGGGDLTGTDRTVARSFIEVFPHVMLLVSPVRNAYNRSFLIGSNEPFVISRRAVEAAFAQPVLSAELRRYGFVSPEHLLRSYVCDRDELMSYVHNAAICTDDRPVIDFQAVAWAEGMLPGKKNELAQGGRAPGLSMILRRTGGAQEIPFLVD